MNTSDLEAWIVEKYPLVTSKDYGKDEDGTLKLIKKHKVFLCLNSVSSLIFWSLCSHKIVCLIGS